MRDQAERIAKALEALVATVQTATAALERLGPLLEAQNRKRAPAAKPIQGELPVEATVLDQEGKPLEIKLLRGHVFRVTQSFVDVLASAYPAVDVIQTLCEVRSWAFSNESERWTVIGAKRGINGWLAREQNKAALIARSQVNGAGGHRWR